MHKMWRLAKVFTQPNLNWSCHNSLINNIWLTMLLIHHINGSKSCELITYHVSQVTILILYLWVGLGISKSIIMEWKIRYMHKYLVWMELLWVVHLTPKSLWGYNVFLDVLRKDIFHTFLKCISQDNLWSITYGWHPHGWKLKHNFLFLKINLEALEFRK